MNSVSQRGSDGVPMHASRPSVWGGVPLRNVHFTGRATTLERIAGSLRKKDTTAVVPHALLGFGGVGKTQIAIEYAYRYQEDYDLVWWVAADDDALIRRSLISLAGRLGLTGGMDSDDIIGSLLDALRRGDTPGKWLLIFDNADAPETIRDYTPRGGAGHVIVTSRSHSWLGRDRTVQVGVFDEIESAGMLAERWPELAGRDARRLADRLGNLPLALEQAATLHNSIGMTFDGYLAELDGRPTWLLEEGVTDPRSPSVARMFQMSYRDLTMKSPPAAELFAILALMSTRPIKVPLITRGRGADLPSSLAEQMGSDLNMRIVVRELAEHALVAFDPALDVIEVHRLVRDLLREALSDEDRETFLRSAHALIIAANPGDPEDPANGSLLRQISPHVDSSGIVRSADPAARAVVLDQIRYRYAIGDYAESRRLGELAVSIWTAMSGPDDMSALLANRHLARALRWQDGHGRVAAIARDTWERMVRQLGAEHEHTLATANDVGADLRLRGRFEEALRADETNLTTCRAVLGESDETTWQAANNLAVDLRLLGRLQEAHKLDLSTVQAASGRYADDDKRALGHFSNLARDLLGLGRYAEALALQTDKLNPHLGSLTFDHVQILQGRRNQAILFRKVGGHQAALELAESVAEIQGARFGETHDQTLAARLTSANTLRAAGRLEAARSLGLSVLASHRTHHGVDHPITFAIMVDVAITHRLEDEVDEALAMNTVALEGLTRAFGDSHEWRLCALANQANLFAMRQDHEAALTLSREAVHLSELVRGHRHPYTLACAANLSLDLAAAGQHTEANARRRRVIKHLQEHFGKEHAEVINAYREIRTDADIEPPPV